MHILLASLNAKYVHTNLAIRYLRASIQPEFPDVELREFTINEPVGRIAEEIFEATADVVGFSCYIWNLSHTLQVIRRYHQVSPQTRIVLGGPEVSFEAEELLKEYREIDAVVVGEGEITFLETLKAWSEAGGLEGIAGLVWRKGAKVVTNAPRPLLADLADLPFPYGEQEDFGGRLVYAETMRGCPFQCGYCLSSISPGVRFLPPEQFEATLKALLAQGARTIKLVDRTFNVRKDHAFRILEIARQAAQKLDSADPLRIHCEMAGELLDQEWLDYLRHYPAGLLQLEIGVQSTHPPTLEIICRPQHFERWSTYIEALKELGHIPLHLDLIAGLPREDWNAFRRSFNDVYAVQPDMLQLGFLKVLKGSGLRLRSRDYGLVYTPDPPYTILATHDLSHTELIRLGRIETLLDRYYNSGKFKATLDLVVKYFPSPFDFYDQMAHFWVERNWFKQQWQNKSLFEKLWDFLIRQGDRDLLHAGREALRFDYYMWERPSTIPDFLQFPRWADPDFQSRREAIRTSPVWTKKVPDLAGLDRRQWSRATALDWFEFSGGGWILFTYQGRPRSFRYDQEEVIDHEK